MKFKLRHAILTIIYSMLISQLFALDKDLRNENTQEISEKKKFDLDTFISELKEAVDTGKLSEEEAKKQYMELMNSMKKNKNKKSKKAHNFPDTAYQYAKLIEPELGVPPIVDLEKSIQIPLYKNGKQVFGVFGVGDIDNPTRLGKETFSGSTLQRYLGKTANGAILPDVVWVSFGRNNSPSPNHVIGSVQMIGYNQKTGATAFFESNGSNLLPWIRIEEKTLRIRGVMPGIDNPEEFNKAYVTPGSIQCVECHQNDPFIHNDFIDAAKLPGKKTPVVPENDDEAPYYVIGGENWDMRTIYIKENACFDCHRIGMKTLELFVQNGWDPNEHMPPRKPGSLKEDYQELLTAWIKGPENIPGAEWIIPPGNGKPAQIVGDEYPNKAYFNRPNSKLFDSNKSYQKKLPGEFNSSEKK